MVLLGGQRCGSGFSGYTLSGKESKTRRTGVGTGIDQLEEFVGAAMVFVEVMSLIAGHFCDDEKFSASVGNAIRNMRKRAQSLEDSKLH